MRTTTKKYIKFHSLRESSDYKKPSPKTLELQENGVVCLTIVEISPAFGGAQDITMWLPSMAPMQLGICLPWKVAKASK